MTMFGPKHSRGTHMFKPQHVLISRNGKERTSNVTDARIMKAVYEIENNGYVTIEKCIPVRIIRESECFAISFYDDSRMAIYFRVRKTVLRMVKSGVSCNAAADIMCDFFHSSELPDMTDWTCEELNPAPSKNESNLSVDGQDFRHFGSADVMAALENIIDGLSKWMNFDCTGTNGGYINIYRCDDSGATSRYKVECVKWTEPTPTGFRAIITDVTSLRHCLWNFVDERKLPEPTPEWERFDVTDYFQKLVFKFSDNENKSDNNDER